jgi:hypothetical protein
VILWKDFVLDDSLGPILVDRRDLGATRSRVREDASAVALIQETRREDEPLRETNTGCVRSASWTKVQAPGKDSDLETNAATHHMDVESASTRSRLQGVG